MINYIWITTQREFIHYYTDAPNDVDFLRNRHRHIFHFKVYVEIKHNNRDVEFIKFKREVEDIINEWDIDVGYMSCEMMADKLHRVLEGRLPKRKIIIEVSEDNENGVVMKY